MVRAEAYGINKDSPDQATTVAVKMLKGSKKAMYRQKFTLWPMKEDIFF